jgi:serine phosphatase RsbU (regulator of sigma subunit)/Flp pilus assembly protein TadD
MFVTMRRILHIVLLMIVCHCYSQSSKTDSLSRLIQKSTADSNKVNLLNSLAFEYRNSDPEKMLSIAKEAGALARELNFLKGEASSNNNSGIANNALGNYDSAITYYQKALDFFEKNNFRKKEASVLSNIAVVYLNKGDFTNCVNFNLSALRIKESLGDKDAICLANINLGTLYYKYGDTSTSLKFLKQALNAAQLTNNKESTALCYHNIGNVFYAGKNYSKALDYYNKALPLRKEVGDESGVSGTLNNIGMVYMDMGDLLNSRTFLMEALEVRKKINDPLDIAETNINLGHLCLKLKLYDKAITYFLGAFENSKLIGARASIRDACEGLAISYSSTRNYEKAFAFQDLYTKYKDSLVNEETAQTVTELQLKYNSEKREKDLVISSLKLKENENEIKGQRQLIYIIVLGLALALVVVFLIYKGYKEKQKINHVLAEKNKDILDSINYAKRIQEAILPSEQAVKALLPESFVLYKPKDIVSGDFYFIEPIRMNNGTQLIGFAAADCTGHGVSGAFMSMLGYSILKRSLTEKSVNTAGEALDYLNRQLHISLRQHEKEVSIKDGMDIAFCVLFPDKNVLYYAAANNPIYVVSNGELKEYKADKQAVGYSDHQRPFNTHEVKLNKGDMVYTFTDGYADQFGGPKGKKFKYKQLQQLLVASAHRSCHEQKNILDQAIESWRGDLEQVDDILIIGVRI